MGGHRRKATTRKEAPAGPFERAAEALFSAPHARFTDERARLAEELAAAGETEAAARLRAIKRPSIPAWTVNHLWRVARKDMEALLESGRRIRAGKRDAWDQQRQLLARLHERAAAALEEHGHSASPAALRRVSTTLQALSSAGSWDPDRPGQLTEERSPPGFEAVIGAAPVPPLVPHPHETPARAAERAVEEEKARRRQKTMERTLAQARASAAQHRVTRLRAELARAEEALAQQREELRAAEEELARALAEIEELE